MRKRDLRLIRRADSKRAMSGMFGDPVADVEALIASVKPSRTLIAAEPSERFEWHGSNDTDVLRTFKRVAGRVPPSELKERSHG